MIQHVYPAIGEVFELGLDGDARDNQPFALVKRAGFTNGWTHNGHLVEGRQIRSFKFVSAIDYHTFDGVLSELTGHGRIPEGQWVIGLKAAFPKADGKGPIGIADATWVGPDGHLYFPCIGRGGDLRFHRASGSFGANWRWTVAAPFVNGPQ